MKAYYNENDPGAAQWLRNLIAEGHIAPGDVDERSIEDVRPTDLLGYTQCHFFAGIGTWSLALRRAGWPDSRPVWTGSCPCQPFSQAGAGLGFADERHLWPAWFHLILHGKRAEIPVFGEQVASTDGLVWLDLVQTDMEGTGYTFLPVDLCAAGVGAPHLRQRLFFVAEPAGVRLDRWGAGETNDGRTAQPERFRDAGLVADTGHGEHQRRDAVRAAVAGNDGAEGTDSRGSEGGHMQAGERPIDDVAICSAGDGLEHAAGIGAAAIEQPGQWQGPQQAGDFDRSGPVNGFWGSCDWLLCRDGKWRPVEPGTSPLAYGVAARMVKLRAYGNGIVVQVAETFIRSVLTS